MERVLQRLGLTSKTSTPYQYRNSSGHAAYGTSKSNPASHSNFQPNAYGGRKVFGGEDDDPGWMELTVTEGPNESKENIVNGPTDVVITTDIVTRFEDAERHAGPSSGESSISGEDLIRVQSSDARRIV
jgi:hypothetical protein